MSDPIAYFLIALKASLFSTGGLGNLPSLHQDMIARHWATDRQFASAIAIGQLAPGPTGLWVVALGYLTGGLAGAALMTLAVLMPPLLAVPLGQVHSKIQDMVFVRGFARGLTIGVAGAIPTILIVRVLGTYGYDLSAIGLFAGSLVLIATKRVPPLAVLILGAASGALLFGVPIRL